MALLSSQGSTASSMEKKTGGNLEIRGWLDASKERTEIDLKLQLLLASFDPPQMDGVSWQRLADQDWQESWKRHFKPQIIGNRLLVLPSWLSQPADTLDRLIIHMDPEMAFGSGSHESTRGCLEALERCAHQGGLTSLLDLGTGSGILAIAGVLLGADQVTATDFDPIAVETSQKNGRINQVADKMEVLLTSDVPPGPFQTIVANILAPVLIDKAGEISHSLLPGGSLILSGILETQATEVCEAYRAHGFVNIEIFHLGEWVTIQAEKNEGGGC
ncbi:MAG: 50S ribosomal protein L11 methyltransferase [Magnetococcales bacterium]|nr:50S ribosomal protein L11 methyltransferase [Magnetococcales bacterium]